MSCRAHRGYAHSHRRLAADEAGGTIGGNAVSRGIRTAVYCWSESHSNGACQPKSGAFRALLARVCVAAPRPTLENARRWQANKQNSVRRCS
jgi:hypothetical protein